MNDIKRMKQPQDITWGAFGHGFNTSHALDKIT
jgi:hypothetical protein